MIPLLIWLAPKKDKFRYIGKECKLNPTYSQLKRKIDIVRIITTVILLIVAYILPLKLSMGYLAVGILLFVHLISLIVYLLKFPNDITKVTESPFQNQK